MGKHGGLQLGMAGRRSHEMRQTQDFVHARPIAIEIDDPRWAEEAKLVAAATGRKHVVLTADDEAWRKDPRWGRNGVIVLTDKELPEVESDPLFRVLRVDHYLRDFGGQATLELVERIGTFDPLRIAVVGAHGGAGTSIFAAGLAAAMEKVRGEDALLVDRDPHSQGLATVVGIENQPGWVSTDPSLATEERELLQNCAHLGEVSVLGRVSRARCFGDACAEELNIQQLDQLLRRTHLVVDCGRMIPGSIQWEQQWNGCAPDCVLVVSTQCVSGLVAMKELAECCLDQRMPDVLRVVRRMPDGGCSSGMAVALLGEKPDVTWDYDPDLANSLDRGMLDVDGSKLAKAARTIVVEMITRLMDGSSGLGEGSRT